MTEPTLPQDLRYERKAQLYGHLRSDVFSTIHLHSAGFRVAFPPRTVNNIYFDTRELEGYEESVEGATRRTKCRVRWYGERFGHVDKPVLELKEKFGVVGAKRTFPLQAFEFNANTSSGLLCTLLNSMPAPVDIREYVLQLTPVLFNQYRRHYFISRCHRFRVTVDSDLFSWPVATIGPTSMVARTEDGKLVVELKFAREHAVDGADVVTGFPFPFTKNSKYVTGIENVFCP